MRVVNVDNGLNVKRPQALGQYYGGYPQPSYAPKRDVAFRFIDEEGFHNVMPGKKFPFTITRIVSAEGVPVESAPINGTALSEESIGGSIVRVPLSIPYVPSTSGSQDTPVDARLSLYGTIGQTTYPIFVDRKVRFTISPASPMPLNLEPIYAEYEADKYAKDLAVLDQQMLESYEKGLATEAQAKAAADKAKAAAEDAASKKEAADKAVQAALNEETEQKKIYWTIGGVAALGLLAYLVWGD
jgi:hypothetical protein